MATSSEMAKRKEDRPERLEPERLGVAPPVDIFENAEELLIVVDVPGVPQDGVGIDLEKSQLAVTARRPDRDDFEYRRAFVLPGDVDAERVSAHLKDGVLRVHLPKRESARPRQIQVRAG